jgi:hypothetical protein
MRRRARLLLAVIALGVTAALAPAPAHATYCANIRGVGDPCVIACNALGPAASKVALCRLT